MDEKPKTTRRKSTAKPKAVPATLMRGPDGHLYAIPHSELEAYRVPEEATPQVEAMMKPDADVTHVQDASPLATANYMVAAAKR